MIAERRHNVNLVLSHHSLGVVEQVGTFIDEHD